jgi:hypothetical protein
MASLDGEGQERSWDEALTRLEDFLLAYPYDRALPDLPTIADAAQLSDDFLFEDDRAHKVLHDAIAGRPLSDASQVRQLRTELELLTLEVEVLTERLGSARTPIELAEVGTQLVAVRGRLEHIRRIL